MANTIFFSHFIKEFVKYSKAWNQIEAALADENVSATFVEASKDIWVRDFMPFQCHDGKYLIYNYNPDYLHGKYRRYITNSREAFASIGGNPSADNCRTTDLVIDGGNMIKCVDRNGVNCVIMTTKVLHENPGLSYHEILNRLEEALGAEVILIPWDTAEPYGHADGMVRSLGPGKLLINCYQDYKDGNNTVQLEHIGHSIKKALEKRFDIASLSFGSKHRKNSWCHLNYLEVGNAVLVPCGSIASDRPALKQIGELTGRRAVPISMAKIIAEGGALHCISWASTSPIG